MLSPGRSSTSSPVADDSFAFGPAGSAAANRDSNAPNRTATVRIAPDAKRPLNRMNLNLGNRQRGNRQKESTGPSTVAFPPSDCTFTPATLFERVQSLIRGHPPDQPERVSRPLKFEPRPLGSGMGSRKTRGKPLPDGRGSICRTVFQRAVSVRFRCSPLLDVTLATRTATRAKINVNNVSFRIRNLCQSNPFSDAPSAMTTPSVATHVMSHARCVT